MTVTDSATVKSVAFIALIASAVLAALFGYGWTVSLHGSPFIEDDAAECRSALDIEGHVGDDLVFTGKYNSTHHTVYFGGGHDYAQLVVEDQNGYHPYLADFESGHPGSDSYITTATAMWDGEDRVRIRANKSKLVMRSIETGDVVLRAEQVHSCGDLAGDAGD